jgi:hypothetical protein
MPSCLTARSTIDPPAYNVGLGCPRIPDLRASRIVIPLSYFSANNMAG